jgi:DNA polymerase III, delta subunit
MPKINSGPSKDKDNKIVKIEEQHLAQNGIFVGDREVLVASLQNYYNGNNIEIDLFLVDRFELSVDDVRAMRGWTMQSSEKLKIVILSSFYFNSESQNAALKILEDTPANTKIFLIATTSSLFLPTVLSRVYAYDYRSSTVDDSLARELLALPIHLRLQNSKFKKLMLLKIENVDLLKNSNKINDSESVDGDHENENIDSDENEESENGEGEVTSSKGRKNKEKHVQLFESLFDLIVKNLRNKSLSGKITEAEIAYMQNLNILNKNIYQYGANPHLSIEYILLTASVI